MATAYATSNFLVELVGAAGAIALGGFADCTGLADRAAGGSGARLAALRRGVVNSAALTLLRTAGTRPTVVITLRDARGSAVRKWQLAGVQVVKYTGPTLSAKGTDVAIEELSLTADSVTTS